MTLENTFTIDKLVNVLRQDTEDNCQKPRQKLINEYLAKKITREEFEEKFKELSIKFHENSILRDKLYLFKKSQIIKRLI